MHRRLRAGARALGAMLAGLALAAMATGAGAAEALVARLDAKLPELMRANGVPGASVALIRGGEIVWTAAYGMADAAAGRPMAPDSLYRVESISKSVTAWGVMRLVERGLVDLDGPAEDYLGGWRFPESPYDARLVTVRQLLAHTSGLPLGEVGVEYAPGAPMPSLEAHLTAEAKLVRPPGTAFDYSNLGFHVLELLVETVAGEPFAAHMAREVLVPLGMTQSGFDWSAERAPRIPTGYDLAGTPVASYVYPASASGGLYATLDDVARFVVAGMAPPFAGSERALSPEAIAQMQAPVTRIPGLFGFVADAYGLGHFIDELDGGRAALWHGGQGHGWMTDFHFVPETGDGIVILTNSQRSWPLFAEVLREWTTGAGLPPVGMSRIADVATAAWVLIAVLAGATLILLFRLVRALAKGARRFAPLSPRSRGLRLLQGLAAIALVSGVAWAATRDYLFISSVLPSAMPWLALALLGLAAVLGLSALAPARSVNRV